MKTLAFVLLFTLNLVDGWTAESGEGLRPQLLNEPLGQMQLVEDDIPAIVKILVAISSDIQKGKPIAGTRDEAQALMRYITDCIEEIKQEPFIVADDERAAVLVSLSELKKRVAPLLKAAEAKAGVKILSTKLSKCADGKQPVYEGAIFQLLADSVSLDEAAYCKKYLSVPGDANEQQLERAMTHMVKIKHRVMALIPPIMAGYGCWGMSGDSLYVIVRKSPCGNSFGVIVRSGKICGSIEQEPEGDAPYKIDMVDKRMLDLPLKKVDGENERREIAKNPSVILRTTDGVAFDGNVLADPMATWFEITGVGVIVLSRDWSVYFAQLPLKK